MEKRTKPKTDKKNVLLEVSGRIFISKEIEELTGKECEKLDWNYDGFDGFVEVDILLDSEDDWREASERLEKYMKEQGCPLREIIIEAAPVRNNKITMRSKYWTGKW